MVYDVEIQQLQQQLQVLQQEHAADAIALQQLKDDANQSWVTSNAYIVFVMQLGFAMLEAGSVRRANSSNIMFKNVIDACICALAFYLIGQGIAGPGQNGFMGTFEGHTSQLWPQDDASKDDFGEWFFSYGFVAACVTIVSGSMAERTKLWVYYMYTFIFSAWVYPLVSHWVWGDCGWMSTKCGGSNRTEGILFGTTGYFDFAGSGVVHITGGVTGLVGAVIVGPRRFRFVAKNELTAQMAQIFMPHNVPLLVLGGGLLQFGWYAFNAGSTFGLSDGSSAVSARITVSATLSSSVSALVVVTFYRFFGQELPWQNERKYVWSVPRLMNGILAGLVAITASCAIVHPVTAIAIGFGGGCTYILASTILERLEIDDPLDAFAVHGACGIWGVLCPGIFYHAVYIEQVYGAEAVAAGQGAQFSMQLVGTLVIVAWAAFNGWLVFWGMNQCGGIRLDGNTELEGIDKFLHGMESYQQRHAMDICTPDEIQTLKKLEEQLAGEATWRAGAAAAMTDDDFYVTGVPGPGSRYPLDEGPVGQGPGLRMAPDSLMQLFGIPTQEPVSATEDVESGGALEMGVLPPLEDFSNRDSIDETGLSYLGGSLEPPGANGQSRTFNTQTMDIG